MTFSRMSLLRMIKREAIPRTVKPVTTRLTVARARKAVAKEARKPVSHPVSRLHQGGNEASEAKCDWKISGNK